MMPHRQCLEPLQVVRKVPGELVVATDHAVRGDGHEEGDAHWADDTARGCHPEPPELRSREATEQRRTVEGPPARSRPPGLQEGGPSSSSAPPGHRRLTMTGRKSPRARRLDAR